MKNLAKTATTKAAAVFISGAIGAAILPSPENMVKGDLTAAAAKASMTCVDDRGKRTSYAHSQRARISTRKKQAQELANKTGRKQDCEIFTTNGTTTTTKSPKGGVSKPTTVKKPTTTPKNPTKAPKIAGTKGKAKGSFGKAHTHTYTKNGTTVTIKHKGHDPKNAHDICGCVFKFK